MLRFIVSTSAALAALLIPRAVTLVAVMSLLAGPTFAEDGAVETEAADVTVAEGGDEAESVEEAGEGDEKSDRLDRSTGIEVLRVTTRRREETLQDVPVSVTAFDSGFINELNISDASTVSVYTPNLVINRTASGSTAVVSCMRGLCRTDTTITDDPYVGIFLNGVYTGKAIGSIFEIADIERIEVNRGPQGTLYGKNTIGGNLNVVTKKPSGEAGWTFTFLGGSRGTKNFKTVIDLPEAIGIKSKVAYLTRHHDPFAQNVTGRDLQNENRHALLADFLIEPFDDFTAEFIFDWSIVRETPWALYPTAQSGILGDAVAPIVYPDGFPSPFDDLTLYEEGDGQLNEAMSQGYSLLLDWGLGDLGFMQDAKIESITAHRRYENDYNVNASAFTSYRSTWSEDDFETWNTSQELQLSGNALGERLEILFGFYYLREEGDYTNLQGNLTPPPPPVNAGSYTDLIFDTSIVYNSYALFTEETFEIIDRLRLTAGVRWTYENREGFHRYSINQYDPGPGNPVTTVFSWSTDQAVTGIPGDETPDTDFTSSTWSPRVILSWDAAEGVMTYGSWSRGYKSGGFNARSVTAALWNPYDNQRVDSFEAGVRTRFWDDRATFNITGFFALNKDMQLQFNQLTGNGFEVLLDNAGEANIWGAEIESMVRPVEGLEVRLGFGYTDHDLNDVINPFTSMDETGQRHLEYSPAFNWSVNARYIFPSLGFGTLSARLDYSGQSDVDFNSSKTDDYIVGQDPYGLLDVRFALDDVGVPVLDGALGLAVVGKNVTNKRYRVGGFGANVTGLGYWYVNAYGPPAIWGGEVSFRWGALE